MFGNSRHDSNPLGVPLDELQSVFAMTSLEGKRKNNSLHIQRENYTTEITVVSPGNNLSPNGEIRAVVHVITTLPEELNGFFGKRPAKTLAIFNSFASLGSLYFDSGRIRIGSRLTIFEHEDAWENLHFPLLLFASASGPEALFGAIRRSFNKEEPAVGPSKWTESDFEFIEGYLSKISVCTTGGLGLTAEFSLSPGEMSAILGDRNTALFQLFADQPHPELGGGLFCLLEMPHQIRTQETAESLCMRLNKLEMEAEGLPPHFGAWCLGRLNNNLSYVMFLPNELYSTPGIALNVSAWSIHRARWANEVLKSMR